MENRFSLKKIPNWLIILFMVFVFTIYMMFFERNIGYYAVKDQELRNDTLLMLCNELRNQIEVDSIALESVYDSAKFEHYLREQRLFIGEGETMYRIHE